MNQDYNIIRWN